MLTSCNRISAVILVLCLPVAAATLTVLASIALGGQPSISVEHAWSRATPVGADVAVGYFTIKNNGVTSDRLAVMLEPGSYHVMFNDLKRPLKQGKHFSATFFFEKAGKMDVTFEVQGIGAGAPKD